MTELQAGEKLCPFCAEVIKKAAVKCRWCGSELPVEADLDTVEPSAVEEGALDPSVIEEDEPAPASTPPTRTGRSGLLTAVLVVLVLLAGAGLGLAVRHASNDPVAPDGELSSSAARAGIMAQAAKLTETAMSYRAAEADKDIAAAERLMTQQMRKKYQQSLPAAADRPKQAEMKVTVAAKVASLAGKDSCTQEDCAVAVVSASDSRARVLVFVNQDATAESSKGSVASPTWELLTLVKRDGDWLIDDMAAA